jgi:hypothetical protein
VVAEWAISRERYPRPDLFPGSRRRAPLAKPLGRQPFGFDKLRTVQQMNLALKEFPPRSLKSFQNRNRYHSATLHKHFPEPCRAIQERFREYSAAMVQERHAKKLVELRKTAYQLPEQGRELFVKRVLTRMSVPRSLDQRIACELMAEIKHEILTKQKPPSKSSSASAKQRPSPDALRAQTE